MLYLLVMKSQIPNWQCYETKSPDGMQYLATLVMFVDTATPANGLQGADVDKWADAGEAGNRETSKL